MPGNARDKRRSGFKRADNGKRPIRIHKGDAPVSYTHLDVYKRQQQNHPQMIGQKKPEMLSDFLIVHGPALQSDTRNRAPI